MEYPKSVKRLLEQQCIQRKDGAFTVEIAGLKELQFTRRIREPRDEDDYGEELVYVVESRPRRNKVKVRVVKRTGQYEGTTLAVDVGDLASLSMRARLTKALGKKDWLATKTAEQDLERLATLVPYYLSQRESLLVEGIQQSNDLTLQRQLANVRADLDFPPRTLALLALIEQLPPTAVEGEPSYQAFTFQQLAGRCGWTVNRVRHRFGPVRGQPFIAVVREGRSNQPTVYRYLPDRRKNRPATTRCQTITADLVIERPKPKSSQFESEELLRYGEKPKKWKWGQVTPSP